VLAMRISLHAEDPAGDGTEGPLAMDVPLTRRDAPTGASITHCGARSIHGNARTSGCSHMVNASVCVPLFPPVRDRTQRDGPEGSFPGFRNAGPPFVSHPSASYCDL